MVVLTRRLIPAILLAGMLASPALSAHAETIRSAPSTVAGSADDAAAGIAESTVTMELRKGGVVHVKEQLTYSGGPPSRTLLTRTRYDDSNDRLYRISGLKGDGTLSGDTIRLTGKGKATLEYDVSGAVTSGAGGEELRWYAVSGWSMPIEEATVRVTATAPIQSLSCFAGELTSSVGCTTAEMDHTGTVATFGQQGLPASQALTVVIG